MAQFLVGVGVLLKHNNRFLLIKRPKKVHAADTWSFPGGGVEFFDGKNSQDVLYAAAKREVLEEVGIDICDPLWYGTSSYFVDDFGNHALFVIFFGELKKSDPTVVTSKSEVPQYQWMTAQELYAFKQAPDYLVRYVRLFEQKAEQAIHND